MAEPLGLVNFELIGLDDLSSAFFKVSRGMRNQVLRRAVNKAGRIMVPPLRAATPKSKRGDKSQKNTAQNPPGTMKKSTGIVLRKYKGGFVQSAYIGHRWPKGAAAHLVEFGTNERFDRGRYRGFVVPRPFMAPVYAAHEAAMNRTMAVELRTGLEAAIQRAHARLRQRAGKG